MNKPFERKAVEVRGIRTEYIEAGQGGSVLLLLHSGLFSQDGVGASAWMWEQNLARLARDFRVIAPDLLGQGGTGYPTVAEHYSFDAMVGHLGDLLSVIGVERAHLVGHDHGAMVALLLAIRSPALARSCVVVNAAAVSPSGDAVPNLTLAAAPQPPYSRGSQAWILERQSVNPHHVSQGCFLDAAVDSTSTYRFTQAQEHLRSREVQLQLLRSTNKAKLEVYVHLRERGIHVPTLVLWGTEDPMTSADYVQQWGTSRDSNSSIAFARAVFNLIQARQPLTRLCLVARTGYMPFREQPQVFDEIVGAFARSVELTASRRPNSF
ncbi:MAG: alpha/beta hydrolase [Burkholderiales bacterium]|nr:alpha/beta hydrolase [Burkholderiales bacterium]